jgi:Ser/Thr protein kinase RdoA (MazF antagonist)
MHNLEIIDDAKQALAAFQTRGPFQISRIATGLINQTFRVDGVSASYVLQRLHPIFAPAVNFDIEAVTLVLQQKKMLTPRLVRTDRDELWVMVNDHCWRMQTYLDGKTFDQVKTPEMAYDVGRLVGRFHQAVEDFSYQYCFTRSGVHDTAQFLKRLELLLSGEYQQHRNYDVFAELAEKLLSVWEKLPKLPGLPMRNSHGDLKISNVLFDINMQCLCLLDLDTLGRMPWPVEMGDAFRSWCNIHGEEAETVLFSEEIFEASLNGYAKVARHLWSAQEKEMLMTGVRTIPIELSTRFLIDVLEDKYWGWDPSRFAQRSDHNLKRAVRQWELYLDITKKSPQLLQLIFKAFH